MNMNKIIYVIIWFQLLIILILGYMFYGLLHINIKTDYLKEKLEYQDIRIIWTINKTIDDKFEQWFNCVTE